MQKNYNPTTGILLCRGKDNESAKLSLEAINAPVGIDEYKFMNEIPDYLENVIPPMESLEARLKGDDDLLLDENLEKIKLQEFLADLKNDSMTAEFGRSITIFSCHCCH